MPSPLRIASRGIAFAYIARETIERIMPYRQLDEVGHCFPELGAIAVAFHEDPNGAINCSHFSNALEEVAHLVRAQGGTLRPLLFFLPFMCAAAVRLPFRELP